MNEIYNISKAKTFTVIVYRLSGEKMQQKVKL
jgi:hypothetical protein